MENQALPRKRGRPKKTSESPDVALNPESSRRNKSTSTKVKASTSTVAKAKASEAKSRKKSQPASAASPDSSRLPSQEPSIAKQMARAPTTLASTSKGTSEAMKNSKILQAVTAQARAEEDEARISVDGPTAARISKPELINASKVAGPPQPLTASSTTATSAPSRPFAAEVKVSTSPAPKVFRPQAPIVAAATNSASPSRVADARPNGSAAVLPGSPKYKSAARKVTALMVALPITIYTTYMLYERLILGREQKQFLKMPVEENKTAETDA